MATWTTVSSTVLEVGKPIRSIDITAIKENITAVMEKAAGAPVLANDYIVAAMINGLAVTTGKLDNTAVTQGKIASAAVGQAQLKTTTASASNGVGTGDAATLALTGGTYAMYTVSADHNTGVGLYWGAGNQAPGTLGFSNASGGTLSYYVDERYFQASPPYNLGNGDIPLFVFAMVNSNGSLRGVSVAPDPTWAYHGPTDIRAERFDKGKAYQRFVEVEGLELAEAMKRPGIRQRFMAGEVEGMRIVEREITQELKNRDMPLFPHPWCRGNNLTGVTVVMLDPFSDLTFRLALVLDQEGARAARELINSGEVVISNEPLTFTAPSGVMPVAARLK